ncbi:hypothetical protein IU459_32690 [Nocardia amamiensis]|uniref:Uncharacterized protein n=1 Tax=Nocardia amamiensis TaxID=404578 RepID=A0ABS0D557_9NOCA|nr:hypothetical protein [Nocardia amamiensis]MBF6302263.1 hypothetical protein [Nocardia amamiensis]
MSTCRFPIVNDGKLTGACGAPVPVDTEPVNGRVPMLCGRVVSGMRHDLKTLRLWRLEVDSLAVHQFVDALGAAEEQMIIARDVLDVWRDELVGGGEISSEPGDDVAHHLTAAIRSIRASRAVLETDCGYRVR